LNLLFCGGRGPSSPHYESQAPSLDRLEPCGERLAHDEECLDSKGERLAHDEERLHKKRLGGSTFTAKWVQPWIRRRRTYAWRPIRGGLVVSVVVESINLSYM